MVDQVAGIGIKVDTDDVSRGIKSLEALASQGPKVERSMQGVESASGKTGKTLANLGQGAGRGLASVQREAERAADSIEKTGDAARSAASDLAELGKGLAGFLSVREFVRAADAVTQLQNQLKLATGSAQAAASAYGQLFEIAQRSRVSFTELGGTFASIARASETLKLNQQQLLSLTESIGNAVTISGASAQASEAALIQLGQGLASGVLRGEELNSILEQTPRLARALADGLGVPLGALRKLGEEGKLTAEAVVTALRSQSETLAREVQESVLTVSQSFTQLRNASTVLVGEIDRVAGVSSLLSVSVGAVASSIQDVSNALTGASTSGANFEVIGNGISFVLETVSVLAANVVYVLAATGRELAALAAQAAAIASGDLVAARAIRQAVREDADKARKEIDELSERILNARKLRKQAEQEATSLDTRAEDARFSRQAGNTVAALDFSKYIKGAQDAKRATKDLGDEFAAQRSAAKEWADAFEDFAKLTKSAQAQTDGLSRGQARLLEYLTSRGYSEASEEMRKLALNQAYAAIEAEQLAEATKATEKASQEAARNYADWVKSLEDSARAVSRQVEALENEEKAARLAASSNMSLAEAVQEVAIARLQEDQAVQMSYGDDAAAKAIEREIAERRKLIDLIRSSEARQASKKAAEEAANEWKRAAEGIQGSITDALMRGFESGKTFAQNLRDTAVNMFRTLVFRPTIQAIVAPLAGGITGMLGLSGAANAASSVLGGLGGLTGGVDVLNRGGIAGLGGIAAGAGGLAGIGQAIGAGFMNTISGGSLLGGKAAGLLAGGGSTASGLAGLAGAALPWVGGAALIGSAFGLFSKTELKGTSLRGTLGDGSINEFDVTRRGGSLFRGPKWSETDRGASAMSGDIQKAYEDARKAAAGMAEVLGGNAEAIRSYTQSLYIDGNGKSPEEMQKLLADALTRANDQLAIMALGTTLYYKEGETATQTLVRLSTSLKTVNGVLDQLGKTALETSSFGGATASSLADLFGGLDSLVQTAGSYYQTYYTEAERAAKTTEQVSKALAEVGLSMPSSREEFRKLVDAQDLTTESGRKAYAALLQTSGAFASITQATEGLGTAATLSAKQMAEAGQQMIARLTEDRDSLMVELMRAQGNASGADALARQQALSAMTQGLSGQDAAAVTALYDYNQAVREQIKALEAAADAQRAEADRQAAIASERYSLEGRLLELQGDTAAIRARELALLDASNRAVLQRIFAIQDEQQAAAAAQAVANERYGLEGQLLQLQGDTAAIRARELASLDGSNRALLERIFALQDAKAAEELAARATQEAAQKAAQALDALNSKLSGLANTRFDLENQLLSLQGRDAEVLARTREKDLAELTAGLSDADKAKVIASYDANARLRQEIEDFKKAQADAAKAAADAARAQEEAARAAEQIKSAWQSVTDSIYSEVARIRGLLGGDSQSSFAEAQARFAVTTAQARAGDQEAAKLLPSLSQSLLQLAEAQATSLIELQSIRAQTAASLDKTAAQLAARFGLQMPKLATGTNYVPRDMVAMLHEGEAVVPRQYNPAANPNAAAQGADMASELRALREENRAQALAIVQLQTRITKLLERWDSNGIPEERATA